MELKGRNIDAWGNVILDQDGLIDLLMTDSEFTDAMVAENSDKILKFNALCKELDHPADSIKIYSEPAQSVADWDKAHQDHWFIPEPFASMDIQEWLLLRCTTEEQIIRVLEEWDLFTERGLEPVLRCLIYLIDDFRNRGIVWGVGRGSSVASYCLFLIGVHKVDSIKYDLDPREFLK